MVNVLSIHKQLSVNIKSSETASGREFEKLLFMKIRKCHY